MRSEKGETLIEAILALSISVIIATAVVTAVISSLSNSNGIKAKNTATNFAQEGLDRVRDVKTQDFSLFTTSYPTNTYCMDSTGNLTPYSGSCGKLESIYLRTAYINHTGQDQRATATQPCASGSFVAVKVAWTDSKCQSSLDYCRNVELSSCFVNTNALQNP